MSRSPAIALLAVGTLASIPFDEAMRTVEERAASRYIWPNRLVVSLGDEALQLDGAAVAAMEAWMKTHASPFDLDN